MKILEKGDSVGIIACSNALSISLLPRIELLKNTLESFGLNVILGDKLFRDNELINSTGKERAEILMDFFKNSDIKAIFDISGGDLCNGVLEYLDYDMIKKNSKPFFGYSDLSVILNALYAKCNLKTYLYQIRNLVDKYQEEQISNFYDTIMDNGKKLKDFNYKWVQGKSLEGTVIGGNIRCLLKLAGTEYMPDFKGKILLLESYSGDVFKMITYLTQYKQMGVFEKINGIILGTYTEMEKENYSPDIIQIVRDIVKDDNMPIIKSDEIGHGKDSKCIVIGEKVSFYKEN